MNLQEILSQLRNVKKNGHGFTARCPSHQDQQNSLSLSEKSDKILIRCHAGCSVNEVCASLGIELKDLFKTESKSHESPNKAKIVAVFDYKDESGNLLYQNVRFEPKNFRQRHFDEKGKAIWNLNGTRRVLYRLPELISSLAQNPDEIILLSEGEKDADNLRNLGFTASSFKGWKDEFNQFIKNANIVLLIDHDQAGSKQAESAAQIILNSAKSLKVIDLFPSDPLPEKHGKDVSDWLELGHTKEELEKIISDSSLYRSNQITASKTKTQFSFTTLDDLLDEPEDEISYLWEDTLISGGFSICAGKPKAGKSTVTRNLAIAVTQGESFLGRETKQGKVIYLCLEEKRSEVKKHFRLMGARGKDILIHTGKTPEDALLELEIAIAEFEPSLVIIDPLSRVLRVKDFNDYGSMSRGLESFIDLARKTNTHILALHHEGKGDREGGDSLLGSTALFGAVDCLISMKKRNNGRTISTIQRYGVDLPEIIIDLDKETGIITEKGDLQSFVLQEKQTEILNSITENEQLTEGDIKERVGGNSKGIVSKAIRNLYESGKLIRVGEGKKGNPYAYSKNLENPTNPENLTNLTNPEKQGEISAKNSRFLGFSNIENPENLENPQKRDQPDCKSCGSFLIPENEKTLFCPMGCGSQSIN